MMKIQIFVFVTMTLVAIVTAHSEGALVAVDVEEEGDGKVENGADESITNEAVLNTEPFVATKEWQEVKAGQSVPAGLHIRLNMETGTREAKLLEQNEDQPQDGQSTEQVTDGADTSRLQRMKKLIEDAVSDYEAGEATDGKDKLQYWHQGDKQGMANLKKDHFSREELKIALKKFKATKTDQEEEMVPSTKQKFRSIEELKKDLSAMDLTLKTDPEILRELIGRLNDTASTNQDKVNILNDLEYYVHQIDNGRDFITLGGLPLLLTELNSTDPAVCGAAAFVVGSAVQSNPDVQVQFLEAGALHQLLRLVATRTDPVTSRALYGLSALVRHFPYAQNKLMELGGIPALTSLLTDSSTKVKVKVITLINDLIIERQETEEQIKVQETEALKQRLEQYKSGDLQTHLQAVGWCDLLPSLLSLPEHDSREKVVSAMWSSRSWCEAAFSRSLSALQRLLEEYHSEAASEARQSDTDSFFRDLHRQIDSLVTTLTTGRDEL